jgi:signal transduction histidine kinase
VRGVAARTSLRRRRLLWRLVLHASALFVAGFVAQIVVHRFILSAYFLEKYKPSLLDYAAKLYESAKNEPDKARRDAARDHTQFSLYGLDNAPIFTTREPPLAPVAPRDLPALRRDKVVILDHFEGVSAMLCEDATGAAVAYGVVRESEAFTSLKVDLAFIALLALALALASWPFARSVVTPIERLVGAVRAFGEGDLRARADASRRDEIGELGSAFNKMAERIAALLRSEKELLANVSHELRTPLARIRVVLELAEERPESARRYLPEIARDLAELEGLVDDVLTAARLDLAEGRAGDALPPLRRRRVEPGDVVTQAAERFRRAHPAKPLDLEVGEALPALDADPALLRRALDNLLDNAQKYSDGESAVALVARPGPGGVAFRVSDGGIGIDEADLPRLFSPFFRTDQSRDRATGGLGLGLTLTKRIVEAHGGTIGLESRLGRGTSVWFTIPAVADPPPAVADPPPAVASEPPPAPARGGTEA